MQYVDTVGNGSMKRGRRKKLKLLSKRDEKKRKCQKYSRPKSCYFNDDCPSETHLMGIPTLI